MSAIKVSKLTKRFGNYKIIKGIDFDVAENKVVGFLGPNGAGKTTTIRMMVGLSKPTSGKIEIYGDEVVFGQTNLNQQIGYLPEQPAFYGWMTGEEYLSFCYDIFELKPNEKKSSIDKLLALVNLNKDRNKKIQAYSNGMKQRLGIAQALINDPKVLILDEPVSALDPIGRKEVLEIIENLKSKTTIFLSTHILADVDKICDEIVIIKNGEIIMTSALATLKEKFAQPILQIEFTEDPEFLLPLLKKETWVKSIQKNGNLLKISVNDKNVMNSNLPLKIMTGQKIGILKYGLVLPETEDLFMELIK